MTRSLLDYYQAELDWLKEQGKRFARKHVDLAAGLSDVDFAADPHVQRLLQGFAFLAARIHERLDSDFPEVTGALLDALSPQFRAPIPSMSILQIERQQAGGAAAAKGWPVPAGSKVRVRSARTKREILYRTSSDVVVWPFGVQSAKLTAAPPADGMWPVVADADSVLRVVLRCEGGDRRWAGIDAVEIDRSPPRVFLRGDRKHTCALHELLVRRVLAVHAAIYSSSGAAAGRVARVVDLGTTAVRPWGFEEGQGVLPLGRHGSHGSRLLYEYFALPERFLFVELAGLGRAIAGGEGDLLEVRVHLRTRSESLERAVDAKMLVPGCTPVINLYSLDTEAAPLNQRALSQELVCRQGERDAHEIHSIDRVTITQNEQEVEVEPLHGFQPAVDPQAQSPRWYWVASRRSSLEPQDHGTDMWLSVVDRSLDPFDQARWKVSAGVTCLSRDLPEQLMAREGNLQVERIEDAAGMKGTFIVPPTPTRRLGTQRGDLWRLVSQLTLNHLSLGSRTVLRRMLELHARSTDDVSRARIESVDDVAAEPTIGFVGGRWPGTCRGVRISVRFDDSRHDDGGWHLMAMVLDRMFASFCSVNSFTQLQATVRSRPTEDPIRWPKRAGNILLV